MQREIDVCSTVVDLTTFILMYADSSPASGNYYKELI